MSWYNLFLSLLITGFVFFAASFIFAIIKNRARSKIYTTLEQQKCKEPHEWLDVEILGQTYHVCVKCRYCPSRQSFVNQYVIDAQIKTNIFKQKVNQKKQETAEQLALKYNLNVEQINDIRDTINQSIKDFSISYMDDYIKSLRKGKDE